ncbi:hypothetical protein D6779_10205, partial [Candidatus Parcubacteria bacterium]
MNEDLLHTFPQKEEKTVINCLSEIVGYLEALVLVASWRESITSEEHTLASSIKYWIDQSGEHFSVSGIEEVSKKLMLPLEISLAGNDIGDFQNSFQSFIEYLSKVTGKGTAELSKKVEACKGELRILWGNLEEQRAKVLYEVGGATGKGSMQTFLEALSDPDANEIWLPTFSAETFRERIAEILIKKLRENCQVHILMYNQDLMEYFETPMERRAGEQIEEMKYWVHEIRASLSKDKRHLLQVRLLPKRSEGMGYFSGLLTFCKIQ